MKTFNKFGLACSLVIAALTFASTAQAGVIITVNDVAGDVVFDSSGSINLSGATSAGSYGSFGHGFISGGNNWYVAMGNGGTVDGYALTSFDGPFGTSTNYFSNPTSSVGDNFAIWGNSGVTEQLLISSNYVSGNAISSHMVFAGTTIAALTMTAGTYNYSLPNDNITLIIGGGNGQVPEPASLALIGLGLLGMARRNRA
ncbi:MAG: PEP-CTERM sorting domain-containing protein [Pseudomonadota bacterium]